jgi:aldehyde:ferredoxin oxidoreductase
MSEQIPGGYHGKVLRVNLSKGTIGAETIDESFCRRYLGGAGFVAYYLLKEVASAELDPLGPENKVVFATGPLTGIPLPGSGRHCAGAISPLTGGVIKSEAGEFWGAEFKRTGFDAVIIEGKASRPVYLYVHDGEAEIRDAAHLWGQQTKETQVGIRTELGDEKVRVAMIGPAGENLVLYSCVMAGLYDAHGRGGLGAVMGSKNLKAVAVRGRNLPAGASPGGVKALRNWLADNMKLVASFRKYGTSGRMLTFEELGNLPVRNFRDGAFPEVDKIGPYTLNDTILTGMDACFGCTVRCKKRVEFSEPYAVDPAYGGPEYETQGALGSNCGVDDLKVVAKASEMCNANSLDVISTGCSIAFAMECFENGLLTKEDTGGIELRFGNADAVLQVIPLIAGREGIGALLADGTARAAEKIGSPAKSLAMEVKKLEVPMHEPRLNRALALGYMVNPHGADHVCNMIDIFFNGFGSQPDVMLPDAIPLGIGPAPFDDIGPRKVALFRIVQLREVLRDSLTVCKFLPYSFKQLADVTSAVTGWDTTPMEQLRVAERTLTMCRLINVRRGFTREDDRLPTRFFEPTRLGPLADKPLDDHEMARARAYYYSLMGWDDDGVPTRERVEELSLDEVVP